MSGVRYLEQDKNKNISPENVNCKNLNVSRNLVVDDISVGGDFNGESIVLTTEITTPTANVGTLNFQTVPTLDNSESRLLVLDTGTNDVRYREANTILNNPFNQDLDTTDTPTFAGLQLTGGIDYDSGVVVQATSISTAVTSNNVTGRITTVVATLAAGASSTFTVNCTACTSSSLVAVNFMSYVSTVWGTNGWPIVNCEFVGNGSFIVRLTNIHPTNALNGAVRFSYQVWS